MLPHRHLGHWPEAAAEAALDELGCPYEAEVNLLLTMDGQIREMNREFRGIDRPTDVLSFPMIEYQTPGGNLIFWKTGSDCFDPETGRLMLGDIVISKEKVLSQAEEYGHAPEAGVCVPWWSTPSSICPATTIWKMEERRDMEANSRRRSCRNCRYYDRFTIG